MSKSSQNMLAVLAMLMVLVLITVIFSFISRKSPDDVVSADAQEVVSEEDDSEGFIEETEKEIPVDDETGSEENPDTTFEEEPEEDYPTELSGETKTVTVEIPFRTPDGSEQRPSKTITLDVPAEWRQESENSGKFFFPGKMTAADEFAGTIVPPGQTIWSCSKIWKMENRTETESIKVGNYDVLYVIRWLPDNLGEELPDEDKLYCCTYYLPVDGDTFITISFYTPGSELDDAQELHQAILDSITF